MFNGNSGRESLAVSFQRYREENNHLITKFKAILDYMKKLKNLESYERSEVIKKTFFVEDQTLGDMFDALDVNISRAIPIIEKLIECLNKEKENLDKHLGNLKHTTIQSIRHLEELLISYNQEQYDHMQNLDTMIPNIIELFERGLGVEDVDFEKAARNFVRFYQELESAIKYKVTKSHIFKALEDCLVEIEQYIGRFESRFKNDIAAGTNARKFVENFFRIGGGSVVVKNLNKHLKKVGLDKDKDMTYDHIKDEDAEKIDGFMRDTLVALFKNIEIEGIGNAEAVEKHIKELIPKKTNIKDLESDWKALKKKIIKGISMSEYDYSDGYQINKIMFAKRDGTSLSLEALEGLIKDKKDLDDIENIVETLKVITRTAEKFWKEDPFKNDFLKKQAEVYGVLEKKGEGGDDEKKDKLSDGDKSGIIDRFNDFYNWNLDIGDDITYDEDSFRDSDVSHFVSLLVGGEIKKDDDVYSSKQFKKVLKSFGIKSDDKEKEINDLLEFLYEDKDKIKRITKSNFVRFLQLIVAIFGSDPFS